MIAYHGSNSNFRKLRISKSLMRFNSTQENEGMGIYFSTSKEVARSYGKYIYTLEINNKYIYDFTKMAVCRKYVLSIINTIKEKEGCDIRRLITPSDIEALILRMHSGGQVICGVGKEIYELLDSTENWYTRLSNSKRDKIHRLLLRIDKELKVYTFNYSIAGIGILKNVCDDIVRIVCKE